MNWKWCERNLPSSNLRCCSGICLEELRKARRNRSRNNRSRGRDLKQGLQNKKQEWCPLEGNISPSDTDETWFWESTLNLWSWFNFDWYRFDNVRILWSSNGIVPYFKSAHHTRDDISQTRQANYRSLQSQWNVFWSYKYLTKHNEEWFQTMQYDFTNKFSLFCNV
jgi:hypothetical protein